MMRDKIANLLASYYDNVLRIQDTLHFRAFGYPDLVDNIQPELADNLRFWALEQNRKEYADRILALIKEAGYVKLADNQSLPLTRAEIFLQEYGDLEIKESGERIRYISPYYPKPIEGFPITRLHISGDNIAHDLKCESDTQQDMLNAGFRKVKLEVKDERVKATSSLL